MKHNIEWKSKGRKKSSSSIVEFGAVKCSFLLRDCPPLHATWVLTLLSHDVVDLFCGMWIQSVFVIVPKLLLLFILILSFLKWYSVSRHEQLSQNKSQLFSVCEIALFTIQISSEKIKKCLIGLRRSPPSHGRRREKARKLKKKLISSWEDEPNWTKCSSVPQWDFFFVLFKFPFVMLTVEIEIYSVKNLFLIFFTLTFLFYFYLLKIPSVFCMCIVGGEEEIEQREQRKDQDNTLKFSHRMWRDVRYKRFKKMKMKIPLTSHDESESEVRCNLGGWR